MHKISMLLLICLLVSCGSSRSEKQEAYEMKLYNEAKELVASNQYKFEATAAFPLQTNAVVEATSNLFQGTENSGTRITLTNNDAYMTMEKDSTLNGYMAYYGEMRTSNYSHGRDTAIIFKGSPQSYEVIEDDKKKSVVVKFAIRTDTEQFNFKMDVFYNKRVVILVYGANRTAIRYEGALSPYKSS